MEFMEAPAFTRYLAHYLDDEAYRALRSQLAMHPEIGDVMPGTGGFRRLRWADARRGKGRRGGLRVIYFYLASASQIWLTTLYDKDEASDLSSQEKKTLKAAIQRELQARGASRPARHQSRRIR